jgi:hypothetical protein
MKWPLVAAVGGMLALPVALPAQAPESLPPPDPTPAPTVPSASPAPAPAPTAPGAAGCPAAKVCVVEPRPTTKVVYGSACKEYCLPHCSLWDLIRGACGSCDYDCGPVRTRHVLIKKTVPGPEKPQCVLKDVPAAGEPAPPAASPHRP